MKKEHEEGFSSRGFLVNDFQMKLERWYLAGLLQNFFRAFFFINKEKFPSFFDCDHQIEFGFFFCEFVCGWNDELFRLVEELLTQKTTDSAFSELRKIARFIFIELDNDHLLAPNFIRQLDSHFNFDFVKYQIYLKSILKKISFEYHKEHVSTIHVLFDLLITNSSRSLK